MKLLICIVQEQDAHILRDDLIEAEVGVTTLATTGGFLRSGNTTFLIGISADRVDEVLEIVKNSSKTREVSTSYMPMTMGTDTYIPYPLNVTVGGATVFVLDVEEQIKI